MRDEGLIEVPNPTINYNRTFTNDTIFKSIKSCIIGPIDKIIPELPDDYSTDIDIDTTDIDMEMEMECDDDYN